MPLRLDNTDALPTLGTEHHAAAGYAAAGPAWGSKAGEPIDQIGALGRGAVLSDADEVADHQGSGQAHGAVPKERDVGVEDEIAGDHASHQQTPEGSARPAPAGQHSQQKDSRHGTGKAVDQLVGDLDDRPQAAYEAGQHRNHHTQEQGQQAGELQLPGGRLIGRLSRGPPHDPPGLPVEPLEKIGDQRGGAGIQSGVDG